MYFSQVTQMFSLYLFLIRTHAVNTLCGCTVLSMHFSLLLLFSGTFFYIHVCIVSCQATCLFCARCYFFLTISFYLHMCASICLCLFSFLLKCHVELHMHVSEMSASVYVDICIWFDLSSIG